MLAQQREPIFIHRHPELRDLVTKSGLSSFQFHVWRNEVLGRYDELAEPLPDSMLWKTQKPQHARDAEGDAREIAPFLGLGGLETDLLGFLLAAHDLGRLVEAGRTVRKEPRAPWLHGVDSENEVRPILGPVSDSDLGRAILLAIRHHADAKPIQLADVDGNVAAWALATVVRDVDKCEGFERHELLPRAECRSYEAYMLQFLAWTFDIVHEEVLRRALLRGGPIVVRNYIDRRLKGSPQRRRFRAALAGWRNGLMAF